MCIARRVLSAEIFWAVEISFDFYQIKLIYTAKCVTLFWTTFEIHVDHTPFASTSLSMVFICLLTSVEADAFEARTGNKSVIVELTSLLSSVLKLE